LYFEFLAALQVEHIWFARALILAALAVAGDFLLFRLSGNTFSEIVWILDLTTILAAAGTHL
jgi:hypothetical protein